MSRSPSGYRDDYREGQRQFFWTLPRVGLAALAAVVAVFLLLVATTPLTIGFGWFSGEANLRSFNHVRQTYQVAFDDTTAMDANARQACQVEQAIAASEKAGDANAASQQRTQLLAIEFNYDRVKGEYEAYMRDHFRGGVIRPEQLPLPYPPIREREKTVC